MPVSSWYQIAASYYSNQESVIQFMNRTAPMFYIRSPIYEKMATILTDNDHHTNK